MSTTPRIRRRRVVSKGFDLIKSYLIPRLDDFSYDLNPARPATVRDGRRLASAATPPTASAAAIASLTAEPNIVALDDGVRVTLVMTVPDIPAATAIPAAARVAYAGRAQSLSGHARSMGRVPGFLDQATGRRGRRPAVPRPVAANPARQPLPAGAGAEQSVRCRRTRSGARFCFSTNGRSCTTRSALRRGAGCSVRTRSNSCRSSRPATRCLRSIRPRPRSGCASRRPTFAASRISWRRRRHRRPAAIQLRRRSRHEKTLRSARAAAAAATQSKKRTSRPPTPARAAKPPNRTSAPTPAPTPAHLIARLFPFPRGEGVRG